MSETDALAKLHEFFLLHSDLRIFALNGSRSNPHQTPDKWQDYDVVFFTDEIAKYRDDASFLSFFGDPLLVSEPDKVKAALYPLTFPAGDGYIYLAQFTSGLRIDLTFRTLAQFDSYLTADSLTQVLAHKDQPVVTAWSQPSERDYYIAAPTSALFKSSVKEFWWQFNNVLKAALREEFLLAQRYLNLTRDELIRLMTWEVGFESGFEQNLGKADAKLLALLPVASKIALSATFNAPSQQDLFVVLKNLARLEVTYTRLLAQRFLIAPAQLEGYQSIPAQFLRSHGEDELARFFNHDAF